MVSKRRPGRRTGHTKKHFDQDRSRRLHFALLTTFSLALTACVTPPAQTPASQSPPPASALSVTHIELPQTCEHPNRETLESVVRVASLDGSDASGVVIAYNRVLTAAHVVNDSYDAFVYIDEHYRPARVLAHDYVNDLAVLAVETGTLRPIRISHDHLFQEEPVWTVGYPLALEQTANFGYYQQHVNGAIHASASTNAGASGGGLLRCADGHFELAGMIRGYGAYRRGDQLFRIEDLSISVPADTIFDFALSAGIGL